VVELYVFEMAMFDMLVLGLLVTAINGVLGRFVCQGSWMRHLHLLKESLFFCIEGIELSVDCIKYFLSLFPNDELLPWKGREQSRGLTVDMDMFIEYGGYGKLTILPSSSEKGGWKVGRKENVRERGRQKAEGEVVVVVVVVWEIVSSSVVKLSM